MALKTKAGHQESRLVRPVGNETAPFVWTMRDEITFQFPLDIDNIQQIVDAVQKGL